MWFVLRMTEKGENYLSQLNKWKLKHTKNLLAFYTKGNRLILKSYT